MNAQTAISDQLLAIREVAHALALELNRPSVDHAWLNAFWTEQLWLLEIREQLFAWEMWAELDMLESLTGSKPVDADSERLNNS